MKLLVIQIKMIGDVLASTVICETLKKNYHDAEVHYLIQKNTYAVVENNPFIDKVIFFNPKQHKGLINLYKLGNELKKENYEIVIDAYGKWSSVLPMFFSGAKHRVGRYKWYFHFMYTEKIRSHYSVNGAANSFRLFLAQKALKKEIDIIFPKIYLTQEEILKPKLEIQNNFDTSKPIFIISVLGSQRTKSLPPKNMAEIIDKSAGYKDVKLVFNYIPSQLKEVKLIYDLCLPETQTKINMSYYAKNLRDFIVFLSQCDALIGNEGGATNISKAISIPTFIIFSPCIRKESWDILDDSNKNIHIHLKDYYPEIYKNQHPKKLKKKNKCFV